MKKHSTPDFCSFQDPGCLPRPVFVEGRSSSSKTYGQLTTCRPRLILYANTVPHYGCRDGELEDESALAFITPPFHLATLLRSASSCGSRRGLRWARWPPATRSRGSGRHPGRSLRVETSGEAAGGGEAAGWHRLLSSEKRARPSSRGRR